MTVLFDVEHLKSFVAIVDAGSFTRAADMVHKTQSAISMQMRRLEERIGKPIFERDGRASKLTDEGERLLDYARRIIRLNLEAAASFSAHELAGRVRLGLPDDYADRYLPEILARFSHSNPRVEVTVVCEPTLNLVPLLNSGELDLAIVTHCDETGLAQIMRREKLLWVTSARHTAHHTVPLPLALGRPTCFWRQRATTELEAQGIRFRILYASWNSTAVGAAVLSGLAVSVLTESSIKPGMQILGLEDGFPELGHCEIGVMTNRLKPSLLADALAAQIKSSLDNLSVSEL
eukprot:gene9585-9662_t